MGTIQHIITGRARQCGRSYAAQELYYWRANKSSAQHSPCFNEMLFDLIAKADASNMLALSRGFPQFVEAFREWHSAPTEEVYFRRHGIEGK